MSVNARCFECLESAHTFYYLANNLVIYFRPADSDTEVDYLGLIADSYENHKRFSRCLFLKSFFAHYGPSLDVIRVLDSRSSKSLNQK